MCCDPAADCCGQVTNNAMMIVIVIMVMVMRIERHHDDDGQVHEMIGNVLLTGCEYCYRLNTGTSLDDNLDDILVV